MESCSSSFPLSLLEGLHSGRVRRANDINTGPHRAEFAPRAPIRRVQLISCATVGSLIGDGHHQLTHGERCLFRRRLIFHYSFLLSGHGCLGNFYAAPFAGVSSKR